MYNAAKGKPLRVTLLKSAASGRVQILGNQVIKGESSSIFWLNDNLGKPFTMTVPDRKSQGIDRLLAIGSTLVEKADLSFLQVDRRFSDIVPIGAKVTTRSGLGEGGKDSGGP